MRRSSIAMTLVVAAALLAGCPAKPPAAVTPTSVVPSAKPPARPAELPPATYETMKLRVQRMRTVGFKDKATGELLPTALAQAKPQAEVDLVPGDYDELTYDAGQLRFARYGYEDGSQPYCVEKAFPREDWQALEDGLTADGFFSMPKENLAKDERLPLFYVLYVVGEAGYAASFAPSIGKLKKAGPLITGLLDVMGGAARMPQNATHMAFSQSVIQGQLRVAVSRLTADAAGDAKDKPFNLRKAEYDVGQGLQEAVVGPLENSFEYPWPAGGGAIKMVAVKLTSEEGAVYQTVLPIRTKP